MNRLRIITTRTYGQMPRSSRVGFTLIEMLVSVTLVLLMMVMFGEIFQLATGSVTKQRIMADNDQNARTFVTVIRGDLDKRSFRTLVPFYSNEQVDLGTPFDPRRGYLSISINNLNDGTDDVLSFTTDSSVKVQNGDTSLFYGRAVALPGNFLANSDQPDRDDGQITPNEAGASRAAEIAYWMRGGRLYRRVMLIREPVNSGDDPQPQDVNNNVYFLNEDTNGNGTLDPGEDYNLNGTLDDRYPNEDTNGNGILDPGEDTNLNGILDGNFWGGFDYSAHFKQTTQPLYAQFNGFNTLLNNQVNPPFPGFALLFDSLGLTWNRFGHNHVTGLPREFSSATGSPRFIGRFTHQETSDARFQYPHRPSNPGRFNPMDPSNALTLNSDGLVTQFDKGNRVGVDLLLSNVHEFRVEVWDERLNDFAAIGHSGSTTGGINGDYHISRRLNSTYGPLGGAFNVFDTWHPRFDRDTNGTLGNIPDRPPYRPLTIDPTNISGPSVTNPSGASLWWTPSTNYQVGDVVFLRREDLNGNGFLDPGEDGSNGFTSDGSLQENVRIGNEDVNFNGVLDPGEDTNGNLVLDFGAPQGMLTEDLNANGALDTEDLNGNGALDAGEDLNGNGVLDTEDGAWGYPVNGSLDPPSFNLRNPMYATGLTFAYRCVRPGRSAVNPTVPGLLGSILQEPFRGSFARKPGHIIRGWTEDRNNNGVLDNEDTNGNGVLDPGEDANGNGALDNEDLNGNNVLDREPDWIVDYNVRPLKAIRITVRFEHPTSKQMKQVTIVQSLRDTTSVP